MYPIVIITWIHYLGLADPPSALSSICRLKKTPSFEKMRPAGGGFAGAPQEIQKRVLEVDFRPTFLGGFSVVTRV